MNRRVGEFDLPRAAVYDSAKSGCSATKRRADASRFTVAPEQFQKSAHAAEDGAERRFRWMEVEADLRQRTTAGYKLLFSDLP